MQVFIDSIVRFRMLMMHLIEIENFHHHFHIEISLLYLHNYNILHKATTKKLFEMYEKKR